MRAVYVMCDGTLRKIGISSRPKIRRSQVQREAGSSVTLEHQFWVTDSDIAARVEIMAHALAGTPARKREWFAISVDDAAEVIKEAINRLGGVISEAGIEGVSRSQKEAIRRHKIKKRQEGFSSCTVYRSERARAELKKRASIFGSQQAAFEALIDIEYERMISARERGEPYPVVASA